MMSNLRAFLRLSGVVLVSMLYLIPLLIINWIKGTDYDRALRYRRRIINILMDLLGVKIEKTGIPYEGKAIFIGNHRSYFDPLVVLRDVEALPVAKAELKGWPFFGFAARATGIIFVKRESSKSRKETLHSLLDFYRQGFSILIYPEGTTSIAPRTLEFRKGTFRVAAMEKIPMVPIAMEYGDIKDAWIGDDNFIRHFFECFGKPKTFVRIHYGQAVVSDNEQELLDRVKKQIDDALYDFRLSWKK